MITSAGNERVKLVRRLASRTQRARLGLFACEGEDLVEAGLDAGAVPEFVLVDPERPVLAGRGIDIAEVEPKLLADLSVLGHPPRAIAVFPVAALPGLDAAAPPPVTLALWRVADPGNLGTLVRAADSFGPVAVCLSAGCADPTAAKALRASAGAIFRVPLGAFDDAAGRRVALVADGGVPLASVSLDPPLVLVLGAERTGLPAAEVDRCDVAVTIPRRAGSESLNVAMAGTIALYEVASRRAARG